MEEKVRGNSEKVKEIIEGKNERRRNRNTKRRKTERKENHETRGMKM